MAVFQLELPLPWLWSCHHCHARYPLGVTRRCLHDGHYFCGGTTVSALTGKTVKRHRACGSEFDYIGWEDVSRWRQCFGGGTKGDRPKKRQGCQYACQYPSACRHRGSRLVNRVSLRPDVKKPLSPAPDCSSNTATDFESFLDPSCFEVESSTTVLEIPEADILSTFAMPTKTVTTELQNNNSPEGPARSKTEASSLPWSTEKGRLPRDALHPIRSAPPRPLSSSPPALFTSVEPVGALASANELGLVIPSSPNPSLDLPFLFSPDSSSSSSSPRSSFSFSSSDATSSDSQTSSSGAEPATAVDEEEKATLIPTTKVNSPHILPPPARNTKSPHISLPLDDMANPPDIDMTDYILDSPTSPISPGFPALFTLPDPATAAATAHSRVVGGGGHHGLLTPKSPDSPTNPLLFIHSSSSNVSKKDIKIMSPPPPQLPLKQDERMIVTHLSSLSPPPPPGGQQMIPVWDWSSGDEEDEEDDDDDGGKTIRISEEGIATMPTSTGKVDQAVEMEMDMEMEMEMDSGMLGLRRVSV